MIVTEPQGNGTFLAQLWVTVQSYLLIPFWVFGVASVAQLIYLSFKASPREACVYGALLLISAAGIIGLRYMRLRRNHRSCNMRR